MSMCERGNAAMQRKLGAGELIDVRAIGEEIGTGLFKLRGFVEDTDYADLRNEAWIWSIGKHKQSGDIYAAVDTRFYLNPEYRCLWLR